MVEAITDEYYSVNANVHRGVHFLSQQVPSCMKLLVRLYVVLSMHAVAMKSCLHGARRRVSTCWLLLFADSQMKEGDEVIVSASITAILYLGSYRLRVKESC